MSSNNQISREVAQRLFATEFEKSTFQFKESDEEMSPSYLLLPSGELANRILVIGTLTEKEDVGDQSENWKGVINDPTGNFYVYAGEYQAEAAAKLRELNTPEYIAVVGKPNTFETDDGDTMINIRPESITVVDEETRNDWVLETASQTLQRLDTFEESEFNVTEEDLENGTGNRNYSVPLHYGLDTQDEILDDVTETLENFEEAEQQTLDEE